MSINGIFKSVTHLKENGNQKSFDQLRLSSPLRAVKILDAEKPEPIDEPPEIDKKSIVWEIITYFSFLVVFSYLTLSSRDPFAFTMTRALRGKFYYWIPHMFLSNKLKFFLTRNVHYAIICGRADRLNIVNDLPRNQHRHPFLAMG